MTSGTEKRIGRFTVLERLGRGAQAEVFLARDPEIERPVAIKVLSPRAAGGGDGVFTREARLTGRLRHPNIVTLHEAGRHGRRRYLVFEYVAGRTLRAMLDAEGALAPARAVELFAAILDGVAHAHAAGVVHLDLSPRNVLVDVDGVPRIADFGLGRIAGIPAETTVAPVGTLRYMAPEHFEGRALGTATDVFAACCMLYETIAGRPAFDAPTAARVLRQIVETEPDLDALPDAPLGDALRAFLAGGLAKLEAARYPDGAAARAAFETVRAAAAGAAPPAEPARAHSTVDFLLRRMRRRSDFPALSRSLVEINRLAAADSGASAAQLANVVLRDYALTGKLLKLANSAFYGRLGASVTSVSQAVRVLGFDRVRIAANGLVYFSRLAGASPALRDALVRSFTCGLVTRHLARRARLAEPEEAFICGLFRDVGEVLTLYYFPEEHEAIATLAARAATSRAQAARAVLGIPFETLGAAVAEAWKLPEGLVHAISGTAEGPMPAPADEAERLRHAAAFASRLCAIALADDRDAALGALLADFAASEAPAEREITAIVESAAEKLVQYAGVLGFDPARSSFVAALGEWARERRAAEEAAA